MVDFPALTLLAFLLVPSLAAVAAVDESAFLPCPPDFPHLVGDACYHLGRPSRQIFKAAKYCAEMRGVLAAPIKQEDAAALAELAREDDGEDGGGDRPLLWTGKAANRSCCCCCCCCCCSCCCCCYCCCCCCCCCCLLLLLLLLFVVVIVCCCCCCCCCCCSSSSSPSLSYSQFCLKPYGSCNSLFLFYFYFRVLVPTSAHPLSPPLVDTTSFGRSQRPI